MFSTQPLGYTHRDKLNRVIRLGDCVAWANGKQGTGLTTCIVMGASPQKLRTERMDTGRMNNVLPSNVIVITQQVERNYVGNVGANMDLEATR
ncbi:MAG: hypothetical protein ACRC6V_19605 [Bacteroidales bacterium]